MELPSELYQQIGQFSHVRDIASLMETERDKKESLQEGYFWEDLLDRDFGYQLDSESIPYKVQYQIISLITHYPIDYLFYVIDRSGGDNEVLREILDSLIITGDNPCELIKMLDNASNHYVSGIRDAVGIIYEERDNIPYKFYMSDSTSVYFAQYIMTIGEENIKEFIERPVTFFIDNIDLFGEKVIPRGGRKYNLRLYENEGFWRYVIFDIYDDEGCQ